MKCHFCNKNFKNIRSLSAHLSNNHKYKNGILEYMKLYEDFEIPKCKYCDKKAKYKNGLFFRKTCGSKNCISKENSSHKHSVESKKLMREKRLMYLKEHPENSAWRKRNLPSYSEKCFENACIKHNLFSIFEIEREKCFFPYYVDFAFNNVKVVIEIDGSQHLLEERKLLDIKKEKVIIEQGWRIFRITANEIKFNSDECIQNLLNFIGNLKEIKQTFGSYIKKSTILKYKNKIKERIKKENEKTLELNILRNKLIESNIDFSKFGWVNHAAKILNINTQQVNKWFKKNMNEFYINNCFKRNKNVA